MRVLSLFDGMSGGQIALKELGIVPDGKIRKFTADECARLQTVPDWYKWTCSSNQKIGLLGNGWTIEVIKHILSYLK